tara:strand:+ start:1338 stop:1865 length:528 start_codon:yes stop_codon:yes gene_type:complete
MSKIYENLNIMYPNRWLRRSKCTNKKSSKATSQQNDEADSGDNINQTSKKGARESKRRSLKLRKENLRYDLIFQDKESGRTIAVLEYKKTGMIKYDDFESGLMSDESSVEKVDAAVVAAEAELKLVNNADSYSKQISAYSKGAACRHVALFNWDHLLLYKLNQKGSGGDAGSRAH